LHLPPPAARKREFETGSLRIARVGRWSEGGRSSPPLQQRCRSSRQKMRTTKPKASAPWLGEASQYGRSAYESPLVTRTNRKKKGNLSERSEFVSLPDLCVASTGTPRSGAANRGRLLWLTFLGETRKVSSCRATPGEGLIEERSTSVTHKQKSGQNTKNKTQSSSPKSFFTTAYRNKVLFRASA